MEKAGDLPINVEVERAAAVHGDAERIATGSIPEPTSSGADRFVTATHAVLFEDNRALSCDACGAALSEPLEPDAYQIPGQGAYVWVRGDSVQLDPAPLCSACASAIGVTALARWEIEEEEG